MQSDEAIELVEAERDSPRSVEPTRDIPLFDGLLSDRASQIAAYRRRRSPVNERSVHPADVDEMLAKGWEISRAGKRLTRIRQAKPHDQMLEDRAWSLLLLMGYDEINENGFTIKFRRATGTLGSKQIDAFACDAETAVIIECKSRSERGRRSLQKDIGETVALQQYIRQSVYAHYGSKPKPKLIWLYVTSNIIWSEPDIERARDAGGAGRVSAGSRTYSEGQVGSGTEAL